MTTTKPRSGSIAFYPKKKALKETPSFKTFPLMDAKLGAKPLNFYGYKAGMTQVMGIDAHEKGITFGQEISVDASIIECPPLKVFGIRLYKKTVDGKKVLTEIWSEKSEKHFKRKIKGSKSKKAKEKPEKIKKTVSDLEKLLGEASEVKLLVHTQPHLTGIGKKKPEISEIALSGTIEQQFVFAKEKFGKELSIKEVFEPKEFIDVKAVTKGKGFQGPVKRFGVKTLRPKSKKVRVVGSIGPWNPSTVMWTVARPGQLGYQTRTEYNKRIILIENNKEINPKAGFEHFGVVKNDFVVLAGSVPGIRKRLIGLRKAIREVRDKKAELSEITMVKCKVM